nr:hypothetical protein [Capnocytophaga canimorsus]
MRKIGLFFGSFNPIHIGHLIIANHLVEHSDMDELWLVVYATEFPILRKKNRCWIIIIGWKWYTEQWKHILKFVLQTLNFVCHNLITPLNTLMYLEEKFPNYTFSLIMGEDNLKSFL